MKALSVPFNALTSFHYFGNAPGDAIVAEGHRVGVRWILDSGAFSAMTQGAHIDLDAYVDWCHRHEGHAAWCASLDVIGDQAASMVNYRAMLAQGVPAVPTVHYGATGADLDAYADLGASLVGLGGVAARKDYDAVLRWLVAMFVYARKHHPGMRFHGWGATHRRYLTDLPFWSADSSGFGAGYRYGRAPMFDARTGKVGSIQLDGSTPGRYGRVLRERYGVTPTDIAISNAANRPMMSVLAAHAAQECSDYYTKRHQVTAPDGFGSSLGTRVHYVDGSALILGDIIDHLGGAV